MKNYRTNGLNDREALRREENVRQAFSRMGRGWTSLNGWVGKMVFAIAVFLLVFLMFSMRYVAFEYSRGDFGAHFWDLVASVLSVAIGIFAAILFLWLRGAPLCARTIHNQLLRIGLTNSNGDAPQLLAILTDRRDPTIKTFEFFTPGISLETWKDFSDRISTMLDITIIGIFSGDCYRHIIIRAREGKYTYPPVMPWQDQYLIGNDSKFVLGVDGVGEPVIWDCQFDPHAIVAGATGSGKTMLQSLIAHQVLLQGNKLLVIDYKASADWERPCFNDAIIVNEEAGARLLLQDALKDLQWRKERFREVGARNIAEFREKTGDNLQRVIIVIDEAADVLCAAPSKEQKDDYEFIKSTLEMLTRQGRSYGFHVVYGIQRPDMSLSGQIRSNCTRFCGRADDNLRRVVFGESFNEADLPEKPGEFLTADGQKFLAYFYDA